MAVTALKDQETLTILALLLMPLTGAVTAFPNILSTIKRLQLLEGVKGVQAAAKGV